MLATITETLRYFIEEIYRESGVFGLVCAALCGICLLSALVGVHCRTKGHERIASNAIGTSVSSSLLVSAMMLWMWVNTEATIDAYCSAIYLIIAIILIVMEIAHYERLRQEEIDKEKYLPKALARLEASNKEIEKLAAEFREQSEKDAKEWQRWIPFT